MKVKFWGTRGSIPVPGKRTIKFGGNTPCIQIIEGARSIIIDAGTGIRELGNELLQNEECNDLHLLISHTHWDHIQGLPFFQPLYNDSCRLNIYSESRFGSSINKIFETQWDPNYFPVTADFFKDKVDYKKISAGDECLINGFKVETISNHHSEGTLGYKISMNGKSIVYMTDNELHYDAKKNAPTKEQILAENKDQLDFIKNSEILIHDAMYEYEDYAGKIGWGHSNNYSVSIFATLASVKKLLLFHYDPDYSDDKVAHIENETKQYLESLNSDVKCIASFDGLEVEI